MTIWGWAIAIYLGLAAVTFLSTLKVLVSGIKLNASGASLKDSGFSDNAKLRLEQHFSRLQGTLGFWKREATRNARFHYYCFVVDDHLVVDHAILDAGNRSQRCCLQVAPDGNRGPYRLTPKFFIVC